MREILLRTAAPALVIVIEVEAVTRVTSYADDAEQGRLEAWLAASTSRSRVVEAAIEDRASLGGAERQRAWSRALAQEPGGVTALAALLS